MNPYVCVVGAVNLDICGRPEKKLIFRDSNPGAVTLTPGGVGRNIAHDLRLLGVEVKFLTAFGGDSHAQLLRNDCVELGMDLSCALDVPGGRTSTYLYITDERGEMQLGLCDTDISAAITPDYLQRHLDVLDGAAAVVLDGNLTRPLPGSVRTATPALCQTRLCHESRADARIARRAARSAQPHRGEPHG
ncbi:MAG: PfkB family carbohydrate kinase [Oscillospiraceae bacterium]